MYVVTFSMHNSNSANTVLDIISVSSVPLNLVNSLCFYYVIVAKMHTSPPNSLCDIWLPKLPCQSALLSSTTCNIAKAMHTALSMCPQGA